MNTSLLEAVGTPYRYAERSKRDVGWARALAMLVSLSVIGGVVAALHW